MKPAKLRQLLSAYGEVGRIYCTPEDLAARALRKKKGGNSGAGLGRQGTKKGAGQGTAAFVGARGQGSRGSCCDACPIPLPPPPCFLHGLLVSPMLSFNSLSPSSLSLSL